MKSTWLSVIVMLVPFLNGARNDNYMPPCANIQTARLVVPMGSPVTATCVISDDCPLVIEEIVRIEWHLDNNLLPISSYVAGASSRVSEVVIPSFNHTRAFLACCVQTSPAQVVKGVEIRAGYLPEAPQNLSCQTNLTNPNTMACVWDPGEQETYLLTKYTLHTKIWELRKNHTYAVLPGVHRYTIPRPDFVLFSKMDIYVRAVNELGEATSVPIIVEPISKAKFDPPMILKVEAAPRRFGCLELSWSLPQHLFWVSNRYLNAEARQKTPNSSQWTKQPILPTKPANLCNLLNGTQYVTQIRVRYKQSPWSEWSSIQSGVTLESAPTGRLDWWMKVSRDQMHKQHSIKLFWKPSKRFCANGQNVSYVVSDQKMLGGKANLCSTKGNCCTFQLPRSVKKVHLRAVNAAGKSAPTECHIYPPKGRLVLSDVSVDPQEDRSLLVQWRTVLSSSPVDFVVDWRPVLNKELSLSQFEIVNRNQTSLVIKGSFEPYEPYDISVYPRFKDGLGHHQTVTSYWRQKAPSIVPKIQIKKTWQSRIELTWDEIPLNQRNGIIQGYKIFYWNQTGPVKVENVDPENRRVVLKDLKNEPLYEAFMMVSTSGGSLNGSRIHFEIQAFDAVTVVIIVISFGVGLAFLLILMVLICFSNHRRFKGNFWPVVPDPANSSIKSWTTDSTQDNYLASDSKEPNPIYLSHLSFLDLPVKASKKEDDSWLSSGEEMNDLGESICGSPFIPEYSGSNSGSVPYATVIFSDPRHIVKAPCVYLRSESKQPLLETEESFSPRSYQNMETDRMPVEQCFFGPCHDCVSEEAEDPDILWNDFPFLRALAMNDL
ncbi:granulocyte colony-stimulating factor receptor-like [Brachionichthys hirsutus]|uniref:granulocyte colony-stimulating factor receptor-like n=1 Tax=Brachionichthys hirsutus TaxID=412623 RepID=UPI003604FFC2